MSAWGRLRGALHRVHQTRGGLVGINRRNVDLVYRHNLRRHYPQADDKVLTKQLLEAAGVPVPETLAVCAGLHEVDAVVEQLRDCEHFVAKPANASGGSGILIARQRLGPGRWAGPGGAVLEAGPLRMHLAEIVFGTFSKGNEDKALVERAVRPAELFARLWADGLCDVRVITLRGRPVMAMVRVPTLQSRGRANLHQGGLGLAVELATGRTRRAFHRGRSISHHPENGEALVGLQLPDWPELLAAARAAAGAVALGYLGVDLVVDVEQGPLVLEINARPGLEIQNVHAQGLAAAVAELPA